MGGVIESKMDGYIIIFMQMGLKFTDIDSRYAEISGRGCNRTFGWYFATDFLAREVKKAHPPFSNDLTVAKLMKS